MSARFAVARVTALPFAALDGLDAFETLSRLDAWLGENDALAAEREALSAELHRLAGPPDGADEEGARRRHALLRLRRAVFHGEAPVIAPDASLPAALVERIATLGERLVAHRAMEESLAGAFAADVERAERAILATMKAPWPAAGLRLVSRSLLDRVRRAAARPDRRGHDRVHVVAKALAYLARFTTKTSPNGIFCATARATLDGDRAGVRGENRPARVQVRLAVGEARKIAACLAADPALEPCVIPRPNPTLRRTATGWTCWRPASPRDPDDTEVRVEVPQHPVLTAFLAEAEAGTLPVVELIAAAAARSGVDPASPAVRAFYDKLVDRGLLVAELELPWSEPRPLAALFHRVRATGLEPPWLGHVEAVEHLVDHLAECEPEELPGSLDFQGDELQRLLPHVRPLVHDELHRCDTATAIEITLPTAVAHEVERFAGRYAALYAALYPARLFRARSVRKFLARWPADIDVELLDLYHGVFESTTSAAPPVGFPEPARSVDEPGGEEARRAFRAARDWFASRARATPRGGEIVLGDAEWDALPSTVATPFSCGVLFQVDAADVAAIDAGCWRACVNAVYPGGGFSIARLASLHSPRAPGETAWIEDELRRGHAWLAREGAIVAEVSFMHGGRTANAGLRPPLLAHEIVLPGDFATPGRTALQLADLVVRFDSASGEFVLRSRSQGVRVLPVVTSGISTEGIVDFLVEVGRQGTQPLAWFPGFEAEGVAHWPRVTSGRIVLFRERWSFAAAEVPGAGASRIDFARFAEVARWRARHDLPRRVFVHTSGQPKPFFVDLDSPLFVAAMLRSLAAGDSTAAPVLHVTEMLPGPDALWVRDGDGRYASEFLLHVARPECAALAADPREPAIAREGAR